jgi:hypothetical protein
VGRLVFRFVPGLGGPHFGVGLGDGGGGSGVGDEGRDGGKGGGVVRVGKGEEAKAAVGVKVGGTMVRRNLPLQAMLVAASVVLGWAVAWLTVT